MHGKRHLIINFGIFLPFNNANYRHNYFKLENAESSIIISHYVLFNKLTAPILLPHPTTLNPKLFFKYLAAISTSLD